MNGPSPGDDADRMARVALTWLAEPGNRAVWHLVQVAGAEATLKRLLGGDIPESTLRAAVTSRTAAADPHRLAEVALHRADRLGARVVVPSDPEWPAGVDALSTLELDGGGRINRDVRPPLCLWVRGLCPVVRGLRPAVAWVRGLWPCGRWPVFRGSRPGGAGGRATGACIGRAGNFGMQLLIVREVRGLDR
jgi:DNA processing protein